MATPPPNPTLFKRLRSHVSPALWLLYAVYCNLSVLISQPLLIFHPNGLARLRSAAYSRLWLAQGAACSSDMLPDPVTLLPLLHSVRGRVLEVGAGTGELLQYYDREKVDVIWGVEPAEDLHGTLRARGRAFFNEGRWKEVAGREPGKGMYNVLAVGAQPSQLFPALGKAGLLAPGWDVHGLFDDVVCVRVLCMVPEFEETLRGLHKLLKPGGRLIVCEHGLNHWRFGRFRGRGNGVGGEDVGIRRGSFVARALQWLYSRLGWSFWMGDCHLERDMQRALRGAGSWREVQLRTVDPWSVLPYTLGYLVKE